jgi:hypothetical protein
MRRKFDWLVLGGGFRSLMAAYGLVKQGKSVALLERSHQIGGFLSPIKWDQYWIDKGPQFFDNFEEHDKALMERVLGGAVLSDIGFSYSSSMKGIRNDDFAIPVWSQMGEAFSENVFFSLVKSKLCNFHNVQEQGSFEDLVSIDGGILLKEHMLMFTEKFLGKKASQLSPGASIAVPFLGRKALFPPEISIDLKRSPMLDEILAAPKVSSNEVRYNLYPMNQNLEVVRKGLESSLTKSGVEIYSNRSITSSEIHAGSFEFGAECVDFEQVFAGLDVSDAETALLGTADLGRKIFHLPEIFHCFEVPMEELCPSFYLVDYEHSHVCTRFTNFCHYMGSAVDGSKGVFCAEQPTEIGSDAWENPESFQKQAFNEAYECKNVTSRSYSKARSFKVPSTYKVPLLGYEEAVTKFRQEIGQKFGSRITIPDAGTLTRKQALDDLAKLGILV